VVDEEDEDWEIYVTDEVRGWIEELDEEVPARDPASRGAVRAVPQGTGTGGDRGVMSGYSKWSDIRDEFVERAGGEKAVAAGKRALMARQHGYQLAEIRRQRCLTQSQVAEAMGVTKGRVSQIERGEVFTVEVLARYVEALGGTLNLVADFGGHSYRVGSGLEEFRTG
jgi:DNA-binding XRE family transcriptional regulator